VKTQIFVSVIVPVYNGGKFLDRCLDAINASSHKSYELIVVDDCSTDNSVEISHQKGASVLHMPQQSGPAAARNLGAQHARGDVLFFVDADVVVRGDSTARVAASFEDNPGLAAVFGSYDDEPAEENFLSQYKNMFHHFVHQQSSTEAETFWAGCGAIDRRIFAAVGGFDGNRYRKPSIEDIELGYRIRQQGHRILLDKHLLVKHLKQWRFGSLLRADILCRAVPWTRLILEREQQVNDLNLKTSDRVSAVLAGLLVASLPASLFNTKFLYLAAVLAPAIVLLNLDFYRFFLRRKGLIFVARTYFMHIFYYLYSAATFTVCWAQHLVSGRQQLKKII
jgi:glycosyltransferase involved in cell wall biosynthesis